MGDAMPVVSDERAVAEQDTAQAEQGEEHAKIEEDMSPVTTVEEQGKPPEEDTAQGEQGEEHAKIEEDMSQATTVEEQGNSGEEQKNGGDGERAEDDELGECPFCLFMKSGPCRDSFISWENCIEDAEKEKEDMVEKCHKVTFMLKECMEQNSDYYEPVLQAEKAMGDAALEEEEEDATAPQGSENANPTDLQVPSQSENQNSSDAPHSQAPQHVPTEEHHVHTEDHSLHASSDEHHIHSSSDAAGEVVDSRGAE